MLGQAVNEKSFVMSQNGDKKSPDTHKVHVFIEELQQILAFQPLSLWSFDGTKIVKTYFSYANFIEIVE